MSSDFYSKIAEGVKLLCVKSNKFKTNCIKVEFFLPVNEHFAALNVLSSYMAHTSKKYSTVKEFNSKVDGMYDACFDSNILMVGDKVCLRFSMEFLDDRFSIDGKSISDEAIEFLTEVISNPNCTDESFDEALTAREIRFTLENIEAIKNDKRAYALSRLRQLMFEGEPYGIDREQLAKDVADTDSRKLFKAYEAMLDSAEISITACGNFDKEKLNCAFKEFADSIADRHPENTETVFTEKAEDVRYFKDEMDVNQAKLVIGLRTGMKNNTDNYFAYRVMTDIFGGGPYSRLFLNVREKMSLCYYCGARLISEKGVIFIQSGIENENYEKARDEILNQLDIMKKGEFSDEDFTSSITALSDAFKGVEDSPTAVCNFYSSQQFNDEIFSGKEFSQRISAVTREQVIECAKNVTVDTVYLLTGEEKESD